MGLGNLKVDTSFKHPDPDRRTGTSGLSTGHGRIWFRQQNYCLCQGCKPLVVEKLTYLDELVRGLSQIPDVTRVDSVFNLRTIEGSRGESGGDVVINTRPVLDGIPSNQMEAEHARLRAIGNPLYLGNLFSTDGSVSAIIVTVENKADNEDFSLEVFNQLDKVIGKHGDHFEQIFQVGPPRINVELRSSLTDDFVLLGPLSAIVLVAAILFFMRNSLAAAIPVLTSGLSIIWTFGVLGWTGVPLNILSAMIPSLIIVIGSTEDTHMIAAYFRGLAEGPAGGDGDSIQNTAINYMAKHPGLPMLLTILTTALGFRQQSVRRHSADLPFCDCLNTGHHL